MKLSNILIGVAGIAIGAGAPADDECTDDCEDDDVVDEEPATEE